jgi:hypothetical protein
MQCNVFFMVQCDNGAVQKPKEDIMELIVLSGIATLTVITIELFDFAR